MNKTSIRLNKQELPVFFKPLLWSYNFSVIEPKKDEKTIIINTINYGDFRHWRWINRFYGKKRIAAILRKIPATEIRPRARLLASIIFSVKDFNYAPRGIKSPK